MKKRAYRIWGKVLVKETDKGIPNVTVKAFDKDLRTDDSLGETVTDMNGNYNIEYSEKDFRELFFDRKPDLYLTIHDNKGRVIKSTKDRIRYNATDKEGFFIRLPSKVASKIPQPKTFVPDKPKKKEPKKLKIKAKSIPLEEILGIGPSRAKKLKKGGISDAKAFSEASEAKLKEILGNITISKMKKDCNNVLKKK